MSSAGRSSAVRPPRPIVLCVLDGFGIGPADAARNPFMTARMPSWERLRATWPTARLDASGEAVGLPTGQMGNSEVGHLNLGAGFPVLQDLPRIDTAVADGSFFANLALTDACRVARERGSRVHLIGLIGPGGVHAIDRHIAATVELFHREGVPADDVHLHAITDGRDTPPHSADEFLPELIATVAGRARIATVSGRFYAMDRDQRWDRTRRAFDAIVHGAGLHAPDPLAALGAARATGLGDEFVEPTVITAMGESGVRDGDVVVHMNFRADRARQLTRAIASPKFGEFDRGQALRDLHVVTFTEYEAALPVSVAFPAQLVDSLAAYLSRLELRQFHLAETEKYAHVTYFFNGGVEAQYPGEDRILIPSDRSVATYDLAPEMAASPITERLLAAIASGDYDFIVVNYANPDMVGHTGVWDASVRALELIDGCLGSVAGATLAAGGALLITGDHGNVEDLRDDSAQPKTEHTTNPVPLVGVGECFRGVTLADGALSDVAPTILDLMGLQRVSSMTGDSLLVRDEAQGPAARTAG